MIAKIIKTTNISLCVVCFCYCKDTKKNVTTKLFYNYFSFVM